MYTSDLHYGQAEQQQLVNWEILLVKCAEEILVPGSAFQILPIAIFIYFWRLR